ncbi:MAG: NADAR family protein [Deltaproteobacteria bacterium]|nr:NADAR family protein [Deltaproteobacteria bacterium]
MINFDDNLENIPEVIAGFRGTYRWLSNFWPVTVRLEDDPITTYPSVEHAYQAAKTLNVDWRLEIAAQTTPGGAKRIGKHMPLRPGWDGMRVAVMRDLLRQKFAAPADGRWEGTLALRLLQTHPAGLVEANDWGDTFWGVCRGQGENQLGRLLAGIREELRQVYMGRAI